MIPKVKFIAHIFENQTRYEVRSRSLTAALARATLVVEALGPDQSIEVDHQTYETRKGNTKHQIILTIMA